MATYILRRLLLMIPTLIGITFLVFMIIALAPGGIGAALRQSGGQMEANSAAIREAYLEDRYGLDDPAPVQYLRWLGRVSPIKFGTRDQIDPTGEFIRSPKLPKEPKKKPKKVDLEKKITFKYQDGAHNCEAVAVDNQREEILFITKVYGPSCKVYVLPIKKPDTDDDSKKTSKSPRIAKRIASIPVAIATGADISPDGRTLIVCTYAAGYQFTRGEKESWAEALKRKPIVFPVPVRQQGEAIAISPDAQSLYLTSERTPAPLWQMFRKPQKP